MSFSIVRLFVLRERKRKREEKLGGEGNFQMEIQFYSRKILNKSINVILMRFFVIF